MCSCNMFGSPGNLMYSYKRIMSSLLENLMYSRNLFKKVAAGKKEQMF